MSPTEVVLWPRFQHDFCCLRLRFSYVFFLAAEWFYLCAACGCLIIQRVCSGVTSILGSGAGDFSSFLSLSSCSSQMQLNWAHFSGQTLWVSKTLHFNPLHPLIHSIFLTVCRWANVKDFSMPLPLHEESASRPVGWWVVAGRWQVRHFSARARLKCLRFNFTIFLSAFFLTFLLFLLFCIISEWSLKFQFT